MKPIKRPAMATIHQPRKKGTAEIRHRTLDDREAKWETMRYTLRGQSWMAPSPGTFAVLIADGELQMSDTDMEWRTNRELLNRAHGRVLIAGLGLGFVILPLLKKQAVKSVRVVEKNADVIALVAPQIKHKKLTVVQSDIHTYKQQMNGDKFDIIYMDIWPDFDTDSLEQMKKLEQLYRPALDRTNPNRWIGCWSKTELKVLKQQGY